MSRSSGGGFANLSPEQRHEIARKGGIAAHRKGTAHRFSTEEARAAGRKGGEKVSRDKAHMSEIGRRGGLSATVRPPKGAVKTPAEGAAG